MSVISAPARPVDPLWFTREFEAQAVAHAQPGKDDVDSVASLLGRRFGNERLERGTAVRPWRGAESPVLHEWTISPGVVGVRTRSSDSLEEVVPEDPQGVLFDVVDDAPKRAAITHWSRGSRARMHRAIGELDFSTWHEDGGVLAMVTLTLPGHWLAIAPKGKDFKRLIEVFRRRWIRATGLPWRGLWKLEFQRRGAPHLHALMRVPARVYDKKRREYERFELWLGRTWAQICYDAVMSRLDRALELTEAERLAVYEQVGAYEDGGDFDKHVAAGTGVDFSGVKFSDPRRTAVYFGKHSSKVSDDKEYQHIVPEQWREEGAGPGRFWGTWGLQRAVAVLSLTRREWVAARRILRHVSRARQAVTTINRLRSSGQTGEIWKMARTRAPGLGARGGGWVLVNDGLMLAWDLGRYLDQLS